MKVRDMKLTYEQRETFYAIMNALSQAKQDQIDKICNPDILDSKKAITLSKYIFKAFELIEGKDTSKCCMYLMILQKPVI